VPKHGRIVLGIAVDQAATARVDYRATLKKLYGGDEKALATLFRVTPYMDGAGFAIRHSLSMAALWRVSITPVVVNSRLL
jgi:hypothetical protein